MQTKNTKGVEVRHSRTCPSHTGGDCDAKRKGKGGCQLAFRAFVFDKRSGTKIRKTFATLKQAEEWREAQRVDGKRGKPLASSRLTLREAWDEWITKAEAGEILSRFKRPYKSSALRGYKADMDRYVLPDFGIHRLADLRADDFQGLIERLIGEGLSGQKVRNVLVPCQALYRRYRRQILSDPTDGLDLPEGARRRERAAAPKEAAELLEPLPNDVRAVYAVAFYAGLRRGELRALRVSDLRGLDGEGVASISVEHSWDDVDRLTSPKSRAGVREVPIPETLRLILADHVKSTNVQATEFVFGRKDREPFTPTHVRKQAAAAWETANKERTKKKLPLLSPIGLHEARHSYSSFLDAAGISETRADRYMGHANPSVANRYRHQLDGQLLEDATSIESYLAGVRSGRVVDLRPAVAVAG